MEVGVGGVLAKVGVEGDGEAHEGHGHEKGSSWWWQAWLAAAGNKEDDEGLRG